jgi:hypothetical protein
MRRVGHVACRGQKMKASKVLVGKLEGKRPLVRGGSSEVGLGLLGEKSAQVPI